ncbi:hypothetical protein Q7C36_020322 [Tachysurus vachellii]|uniref:Secreted protein n=1 Tax=Tachysurus vachellii TaxID=175792 RepID=A0AA88LTE5_TACVA|nr:hypothetical protein Q7C36_020322 [Tachysurus vachellii]
MRAAGPVLLLVALVGCQSVFSASLEVASKEGVSDESVHIRNLQKSDETEAKAESKDNIMVFDCFGGTSREQAEQRFIPTTSSSSEEMTRDTETMSTKEEKTEAEEGAEARVEVQTQSLDMAEEDRDDAEERFDTDVLKRAGEGNTAVQ